jgi:hypothetical protein
MATIHHDGGRHARAPVHKPSEKTTAAQNNGCRDAFRSCIMKFDPRQSTEAQKGSAFSITQRQGKAVSASAA